MKWHRQVMGGVIVFLVFAANAQATALKPDSLVAKGLNYETELTGIYLGDFKNARLERASAALSVIFDRYLDSFAKYCSAYLPENKVEMTVKKCDTEQVTTNGWGVETDRHCVSWTDVGTGLYAEPVLYSSSKRLNAKLELKMVSQALAGSDPFASRSMVDDAVALGNDMESLIRNNGCSSPALKRFQENLYRFVEDKPPLLLPHKDTLASVRNISKANFKTENINLSKLIDDLVIENSRSWMMNRYESGSVTDVQLTHTNSDGSPNTVAASYRFQSFNGPANGTV